MTPPRLDPSEQRAYARMVADLRRVCGDRFVALVAGDRGGAAFITGLSADDLEALAPLVESWQRDCVGAPLLMTPDEFRRSLDTFPAEYQTMLDHHVVIAGTPPFEGLSIRAEDLRRACETQARGHLIHLRQGWVEAGGHAHALEDLIERSAAPLRQLLENLAQLHGEHPADNAALAAFAERLAGLPRDLVAAILDLHPAPRAPHQAHALLPRLPEYLAAAERLWHFVDVWRTR